MNPFSMMKNLDGIFIWVKLIFHRINTGNDEDFKFLYMVEDIHGMATAEKTK